MYRLEITTADQYEKIIFNDCYNTWIDLKNDIDFFKKLKLENVYIKAYKEQDDDLLYIGNFTDLESPEKKKYKKKIKTSTKIIIIEFLLFPFMLLKEILKDQ